MAGVRRRPRPDEPPPTGRVTLLLTPASRLELDISTGYLFLDALLAGLVSPELWSRVVNQQTDHAYPIRDWPRDLAARRLESNR